jgi:hypothetical protein
MLSAFLFFLFSSAISGESAGLPRFRPDGFWASPALDSDFFALSSSRFFCLASLTSGGSGGLPRFFFSGATGLGFRGSPLVAPSAFSVDISLTACYHPYMIISYLWMIASNLFDNRIRLLASEEYIV